MPIAEERPRFPGTLHGKKARDREMTDSEYEHNLAYCPSCGAEVYLYAERCPECGDYISPTLRRKRRRLWIPIVALIVLAAFFLLILRL